MVTTRIAIVFVLYLSISIANPVEVGVLDGLFQLNSQLGDALINATRHNDENAVRTLLRKGAQKNYADEHGETALHIAALWGYDAIAKLLLDNGAALNLKDEIGLTPLIRAVAGNHENIVRMLLDKGADKNIRSNEGKTALDLADEYGFTKIAEMLRRV